MKRRRVLAAAGTAAVTGLAGCSSVLGDEEYDVGMTATEFVPEELIVEVGTTVVWKNTSARAHTVTAYENLIPEDADYFASGGYDDELTARQEWWDDYGGIMESGDTFSHTFEVPGEYGYVCVPHETGGMTGRVFVED
ncbi:Halocyanin [Halalkaliarchaeum sp. AArc-CO]|uniref:plastocyanin/azurin family copper-binding protein n=1 Tax=unclassified Halalkaliarchaeum TaxID=2678344 RepID=UPI00217DDED2|nr:MULTISPECIES: plastocyanin/azurin family copper-binding protein [unclassified Halalkaliarchaeum]MDR5674301.1 plastocyanin/azurin family copper-binding protein [Halalkaliarchaeum sp. AArc-GB]UWG50724.1 Halocyanin [Halalkaliarchaeum sp. AArc-CO]